MYVQCISHTWAAFLFSLNTTRIARSDKFSETKYIMFIHISVKRLLPGSARESQLQRGVRVRGGGHRDRQSSAGGHTLSSPSGMDPTWARGCNPLLEVTPIPHLQEWTQPEPGAAILCWRSRLFLTFRNGPNLSQGLQYSAGGHAYSSPSGMDPTWARGCSVDFPDFYTIKSLRVGDFGVKIKNFYKNI